MLDNIQQRNAALGVTLLLLVFIVYMIFDFSRHDDVQLMAWFGVMAENEEIVLKVNNETKVIIHFFIIIFLIFFSSILSLFVKISVPLFL